MERHYQYLPEITFQLGHAPLSALTFSLDGQFIAAGINRLLRIWDLESKGLPTAYLEYYAHEAAFVTTLLWTRFGLFSAYSSGEIALLSFDEDARGKLCHCRGFQASIKSINHLALDETTLQLAIAGEDGIAILKPTGTDLQWSGYCTIPQPRGVPLREIAEVTSLAWLPSSKYSLLVSYSRYGILIWDVEKKEPIRSLSPGPVPHGFLSPDGLYFAVSNERNLVTPDVSVMHPLTFMHEGRCLLGGGEGKIKMWRLDNKDCIVTLQLDHPHQIQLLAAHTGRQSRLFRIAAGYNTGVVTIWTADVSDLITRTAVESSPELQSLPHGAPRNLVTFLSMMILGLAVVYFTAS